MDNLSDETKQNLEQNYVRNTYDSIAQGFSCTRYKKWPKVDEFLQSLPASALLLDIGCGNGKYLDNAKTINIGCDVSLQLLSICKSKGFEVVQCDMKRLPFKDTSFDAIICIAALHHIVSEQRRKECCKGMVNLLSDYDDNRLLIQVWSYEQELNQDNPYLKQTKSNKTPPTDQESSIREVTVDDAITIPIHKNRTPFTNQDLLVPFNVHHTSHNNTSEVQCNSQFTEVEKTYLRYYHVFKKDELEGLFFGLPKVRILNSYYDKGNWCIIITKNEKG